MEQQQREKVFATIEGILLDKFASYPDDIREEANLIEEVGLDSLDKVELIMECEKKFSINIDDEVSDGIETIGQLVGAVNERVMLRS